MDKTIIVNLSLQESPVPIGYSSNDESIPSTDCSTIYPINAFLQSKCSSLDTVTVLLVGKNDPNERVKHSIDQFTTEFGRNCASCGLSYRIIPVLVPYDADLRTQKALIKQLVELLQPNNEIISDITFGAKDFAIVLMSVLSFAIKHLDCTADYILYREVFFQNGFPERPVIRNFAPLLHLTSLIYTLDTADPSKAKKILESVLSF